MLNERQTFILKVVVEIHTRTGEPVGSGTVHKQAAQAGLKASPATIRNAMAELEELGLLEQPHTSAGRIPTDQGFRSYVEELGGVGGVLSNEVKERIHQFCERGGSDPDRIIHEAGKALGTLLPYAGLVMAPQVENGLFLQMQLIPLDEKRVLAVLVSDAGQIQNRVFDMEEAVSVSELDEISAMINVRLKGMAISRIHSRLTREAEEDLRLYGDLKKNLLETVFQDEEAGGGLIVNGRTNLFRYPELAETPKMTALMKAMEGKRRLISLLDQCLDSDGVQLFIGGESAMGQASGCSLVGANFTGPGARKLGSLGIIGPTRLDYARVIPFVEYTAQVLSRLLAR